MTKFSAAQVEAAIEEEFDGYPEEFYGEVGTDGYELTMLDGAVAYGVAREGGYEGGGDYMDVVFRIGQQFFRKQGTHNSWDASYWDGTLEEVEPYQETVTKYRAV